MEWGSGYIYKLSVTLFSTAIFFPFVTGATCRTAHYDSIWSLLLRRSDSVDWYFTIPSTKGHIHGPRYGVLGSSFHLTEYICSGLRSIQRCWNDNSLSGVSRYNHNYSGRDTSAQLPTNNQLIMQFEFDTQTGCWCVMIFCVLHDRITKAMSLWFSPVLYWQKYVYVMIV